VLIGAVAHRGERDWWKISHPFLYRSIRYLVCENTIKHPEAKMMNKTEHRKI
jgi:hypothetical protein